LDQGQEGACTGSGLGAVINYLFFYQAMLRAAAGTFEKQRKAQPYFAAQAAEALAELRRHRAD